MPRLTARQWQLLIAIVVVGVLMQVAWTATRTQPSRKTQHTALGTPSAPDASPASGTSGAR